MTARDCTSGAPSEERNELWIREQVEHMLGSDEAPAWLNMPNSHPNGRTPQQLLGAGEVDRLRRYITSLLDDAYL